MNLLALSVLSQSDKHVIGPHLLLSLSLSRKYSGGASRARICSSSDPAGGVAVLSEES